jgi:predicted house-cleaning noncanonical NTP pyrophosphatase (MazG superfamily)
MKLVRNHIPEIIGYTTPCEFTTIRETYPAELVPRMVQYYLVKKIVEEAIEIDAAESDSELAEEIGDLLDVVDSLLAVKGCDFAATVQRLRRHKTSVKGNFSDGVLLK